MRAGLRKTVFMVTHNKWLDSVLGWGLGTGVSGDAESDELTEWQGVGWIY